MSPTFHPFPRLPPELRQRIWELSVEPRKVAIWRRHFHFDAIVLFFQTPPLLHACAESRSHLQRSGYYVKAFDTTGIIEIRDYKRPYYAKPAITPQYTWVNFDLDTIYVSQYELGKFPAEHALIQRMFVESQDYEAFWDSHRGLLWYRMPALQSLTILHADVFSYNEEQWWWLWDGLMGEFYCTDEPVHFYTRIIGPPGRTFGVAEVDQHTFIRVEREARRKRLAEHPEWWDSDYEVSDSDDDDRGPDRFHTWWHAPGCDCPGRRDASAAKP